MVGYGNSGALHICDVTDLLENRAGITIITTADYKSEPQCFPLRGAMTSEAPTHSTNFGYDFEEASQEVSKGEDDVEPAMRGATKRMGIVSETDTESQGIGNPEKYVEGRDAESDATKSDATKRFEIGGRAWAE